VRARGGEGGAAPVCQALGQEGSGAGQGRRRRKERKEREKGQKKRKEKKKKIGKGKRKLRKIEKMEKEKKKKKALVFQENSSENLGGRRKEILRSFSVSGVCEILGRR
jgi:hypothetical protein